MPRRRRSSGCWTGALCGHTLPMSTQPGLPSSMSPEDAATPCVHTGTLCTDAALPWLQLGRTCSACVLHSPRGDASAPAHAPVQRKLFGARQSSSSSASTATQDALSTRQGLDAPLTLQPLPLRAACASAPDVSLFGGCKRASAQGAPPQTPCECTPDIGVMRSSEGAHTQPGPQDIRNSHCCTCSPWRAPPLQRLLDLDRHGQLKVAEGYQVLMASAAARGAPQVVSGPARGGCTSTLVRLLVAY